MNKFEPWIFCILFVFFLFLVLYLYYKETGSFFSLIDDLYQLHRKAYKKYQREVIGNKTVYHRYAADFCNENMFIHDGQSKITIEKLNERNKNYGIVQALLVERDDLTTKYFEQPRFSYKDFQELRKEFNTTPISTENEGALLTKGLVIPENVLKALEKERLITIKPLQWIGAKNLCAYFIDNYFKYSTNKWDRGKKLFGVNNLAQLKDLYENNNSGKPRGYEIIDKILSDI